MTNRLSIESEGDVSKPSEPARGAHSSLKAPHETEAGVTAAQDATRISRRTAIMVGSAAAGSSLLPLEVVAQTLATEATTPEFLARLRQAIQTVNELRDIRAEFASCSQRIMRMDPLGAEARQAGWSESLLYFEQTEAERRAFNAANGISCKAPAALKAEARQLEIALTRYILKGTVRPAKPDWEGWAKKRHAFAERWLAGRAKRIAAA